MRGVLVAAVVAAMLFLPHPAARAGTMPALIDSSAVWTALAEHAATAGVSGGIASGPTADPTCVKSYCSGSAEAGAVNDAWNAVMPAGCRDRTRVDCVVQAMEASGASDAAVQYYETTGAPLLKFWSVGPVDLGMESDPCGDCPPGVWVLLNGSPARIYPSCGSACVAAAASPDAVDPLPLPGEPGVGAQFQSLSAAEPQLVDLCGAAYMELESDWDDPVTGDQVFLFQQRLSGPPAGCTGALGYRVRFVAEFRPDGTPLGERAVGFCEDKGYPLPSWPVPMPVCPVPMIGYDTLTNSAVAMGHSAVPRGWRRDD